MTRNKYIDLGLYLLVFVLASWIRWSALNQTSFANGWDSYFYLIQVQSWYEEGAMHSPGSSLIYPLLYGSCLLIGDYVLAYKALSALLAGLLVALVFRLGWQWSKNYLLALSVTGYLLVSPHLTYFTSQYLKNLLGVVLFLWTLSFVRKNTFRHIVLIGLSFFGHRLTFMLSLLSLGTFLKQGKWVKIMGWSIFALMGALGLGYFIPGVLSFADVSRFSGSWSNVPQFSPFRFLSEFGESLLSLEWRFEIVFDVLLLIVGLGWWIYCIREKKNDPILLLLLVVLGVLLFPFLKWDINGLSYRFFLLFPLLVPLLVLRLTNQQMQKVGAISLLLVSAFLMGGSQSAYDPDKHDPDYGRYLSVSRQVINKGLDIELLIAHKSLAELFTFTTGVDAMPWRPEYGIDSLKLWRLATGVDQMELEYFVGKQEKTVYPIGLRYVLVREDVWQDFLKKLEEKGEVELLKELTNWRNPHDFRPGYLLKDKRKD